METLTINKENVLNAANKCPDAKRILSKIFPEVFTPKVTLKAGDIIQQDGSEIFAILPMQYYSFSIPEEDKKYVCFGLDNKPSKIFSNDPRPLSSIQEEFDKYGGEVIGKVVWKMNDGTIIE